MQSTLIGGGRGWLDSPAARSLARVDVAVLAVIGRILQISDAGRTGEYQQYLNDLYYGPNRPAWLGKPAPRGQSPHERGNAMDTNDWVSPLVYAILRDHGWRCWSQGEQQFPAKGEPWHWVYYPHLDNHRAVPMVQGADGVWRIANPTVPQPIRPPEEDHMLALNIKDAKGFTHKATLGLGTFRHLIHTDNPDWVRDVVRAEDDWVDVTVDRLPVLLRTYGCDVDPEIFRIVDNGKGGNTMRVLNPLSGKFEEGAVWSAENVNRALLTKLLKA